MSAKNIPEIPTSKKVVAANNSKKPKMKKTKLKKYLAGKHSWDEKMLAKYNVGELRIAEATGILPIEAMEKRKASNKINTANKKKKQVATHTSTITITSPDDFVEPQTGEKAVVNEKIVEIPPDQDNISKETYYISNHTKPRHFNIEKGKSKQKEYCQIEGSPCKFMKVYNQNGETMVTLNSFTSARRFDVSLDELESEFFPAEIDQNGNITNLDKSKYPIGIIININEFDKRSNIASFGTQVKRTCKNLLNSNDICQPDKLAVKAIQDKLVQMENPQGSSAKIIPTLDKYKADKIENIKKENHKRIGNPIFNRQKRWCPIGDNKSWDDYENSPSYPYPIGIREKDFCLPSAMIETLCTMLIQILTFKNVSDKLRASFKPILEQCGFSNMLEHSKIHRCKYCGEEMDINEYKSEYKSTDNFMEICHRDPYKSFSPENMYWGHGECNRRQGGFTESDRIYDGLRLIIINPEEGAAHFKRFSQDEQEQLKKIFMKLPDIN